MPFQPDGCSDDVDRAITAASRRYNVPRWFLYALVNRESSFDPNARNTTDGSANTPWYGSGLTQLTGPHDVGMPWPMDLMAPDQDDPGWIDSMALREYRDEFGGDWVDMNNVSPLHDRMDPDENLDRFCTIHAVPFWLLQKKINPKSDDELWRHVAHSWFRGVYADYDPDHSYLNLYDEYVDEYIGAVEADDGMWHGEPHYANGDGGGNGDNGDTTVAISLRVIGDPELPPYFVVADAVAPMDIKVDFLVDALFLRTENHAPYSLFGDSGPGSAPRAGMLGKGPHQITARMLSQAEGMLLRENSLIIVEGGDDDGGGDDTTKRELINLLADMDYLISDLRALRNAMTEVVGGM